MSKELTRERLRGLLDYDPASGIFTWKVGHGSVKVGDVAGHAHRSGYIYVHIDRKHYLAHRLAFLWMVGAWPSKQVDHINRVRSDNRWENLRDVSNRENSLNNGRNTSGHKGVCWNKSSGRWQASIGINGAKKFLGQFDRVEDAAAAYASALRVLGEAV